MKIIKHNKNNQEFSLDKLSKFLDKVFYGLKISKQDLLNDFESTLFGKKSVDSLDMYDLLINTSLKKCVFTGSNFHDLEWSKVSQRLKLKKLYKEIAITRNSKKLEPYNNLDGFVKNLNHLIAKEIFSKNIVSYISTPIIGEYYKIINPEMDNNYDFAGFNLLCSRYLTKYEGKVVELPQEMFLIISMLFADISTDYMLTYYQNNRYLDPENVFDGGEFHYDKTKEFYEAIASGKISLATPILSNLRKKDGNLASCFPAGQQVYTSSGFKSIENIIKGNIVISHDNTSQKVINTQVKKYAGRINTISLFGLTNLDLSSTEEHRIFSIKKEDIDCNRKKHINPENKFAFSNCLTNNGQYKRCFKYALNYKNDCPHLNKEFTKIANWNEIRDLNIGDYVSISYPKEINEIKEIDLLEFLKNDFPKLTIDDNGKLLDIFLSQRKKARPFNVQVIRINQFIPVNEKLMRLIGYYISEGYINSDKCVVFTFNIKEKQYAEDIIQIVHDLFNIKVYINENLNDNSMRVNIHSKFIAKFFLKLVGTHFNEKKLNDLIMFAPFYLQKELLNGIMRGDGCAFKDKLILVLANQSLMYQLYLICLRIGLSPLFAKGTKLVKGATELISTIVLSYKKDKDFIDFVGKDLNKLKILGKLDISKSFWFEGNYFTQIKDKQITEVQDIDVYDLQIENSESFNVSFIGVHNCFIDSINDSWLDIAEGIKTIGLISKNGGGVGVNISRIRASGSYVNQVKGASGGVINWIKLINDTAVAVNQNGNRSGAVTVALDTWHLDIESFLDIQTENGDQRNKAYDIFPQVVISDLFMQRCENNEMWTLFDPYEIRTKYNKELCELWGSEFESFYSFLESEVELGNIKLFNKISARELIKKIMKTTIETGMPYVFFKDTVNRANPNKNEGIIGNGNLCMESYSNFKPTVMKSANEVLNQGEIHVCSLASLNLSILLNLEDIKKYTRIEIEILDNIIDLTKSPIIEGDTHNNKYRIIGGGLMGYADHLAIKKIRYNDSKAVDYSKELAYNIYITAVEKSAELAKERGSYPAWKNAELPLLSELMEFPQNDYEDNLRSMILNYGLRNGSLLAIAPNTSTSVLLGCSSSFLPVFNKFFIDKNSKGSVPVYAKYLSPETFWYYQENKNLDQQHIINITSALQQWVDQGISMEWYIDVNKVEAIDFYNLYMNAWKQKCKTVYYIRQLKLKKEECISCAN